MRYLITNPRAMDTLDGMARWWLDGAEGGECSAVAAAVRWMLRAGWMVEGNHLGVPVYGATATGLVEGERYLRSLRELECKEGK